VGRDKNVDEIDLEKTQGVDRATKVGSADPSPRPRAAESLGRKGDSSRFTQGDVERHRCAWNALLPIVLVILLVLPTLPIIGWYAGRTADRSPLREMTTLQTEMADEMPARRSCLDHRSIARRADRSQGEADREGSQSDTFCTLRQVLEGMTPGDRYSENPDSRQELPSDVPILLERSILRSV